MSHEQQTVLTSQIGERTQAVNAGHMLYEKFFYQETPESELLFVKKFNPDLLTHPEKAAHLEQYLEKEALYYAHLRAHDYPHIPATANYRDRALSMSAHLPKNGWLWDAPLADETLQKQYCDDAFAALARLATIPTVETALQITGDHQTSMQSLRIDGYEKLATHEKRRQIAKKILLYKNQFHSHVQPGVALLGELLEEDLPFWQQELDEYTRTPYDHTSHYDARQSNIAWHPKREVSIVDWSWASPGPVYGDTTMLTIDLFKSGVALPEYASDLFDRQHALLLTGYWLARSVEPTPTTDDTVRFHQLASAATAATLLNA